MLCTNSAELLYSIPGKMSLNFRGTSNPPEYNPAQKNLIVTWDILMQNYRSINMNSCSLISIIPDGDEFWNYFTDQLAPMSPHQKQRFMDT